MSWFPSCNDGAYRNDTLQVSIQTVDVLQHLLHTLFEVVRIAGATKKGIREMRR